MIINCFVVFDTFKTHLVLKNEICVQKSHSLNFIEIFHNTTNGSTKKSLMDDNEIVQVFRVVGGGR